MTRLMVWGTSDDLIEVSRINGYPDKTIHLAELGGYDTTEEAPGELHFSDGTILHDDRDRICDACAEALREERAAALAERCRIYRVRYVEDLPVSVLQEMQRGRC